MLLFQTLAMSSFFFQRSIFFPQTFPSLFLAMERYYRFVPIDQILITTKTGFFFFDTLLNLQLPEEINT